MENKVNKFCSMCNKELPIESFGIRRASKDGKNSYCRKCLAALKKSKYHNTPEKFRIQGREYYGDNSEKAKLRAKFHRGKLFNEVLDHYGRKCSITKCGNTKNLCVDHIGGNDGNSPKAGMYLWRWLKKNNFPKGFRILCLQCNTLDGQLRKRFELNGIDELIELVSRREGGKYEDIR